MILVRSPFKTIFNAKIIKGTERTQMIDAVDGTYDAVYFNHHCLERIDDFDFEDSSYPNKKKKTTIKKHETLI